MFIRRDDAIARRLHPNGACRRSMATGEHFFTLRSRGMDDAARLSLLLAFVPPPYGGSCNSLWMRTARVRDRMGYIRGGPHAAGMRTAARPAAGIQSTPCTSGVGPLST